MFQYIKNAYIQVLTSAWASPSKPCCSFIKSFINEAKVCFPECRHFETISDLLFSGTRSVRFEFLRICSFSVVHRSQLLLFPSVFLPLSITFQLIWKGSLVSFRFQTILESSVFFLAAGRLNELVWPLNLSLNVFPARPM